jgi:hypothetical protein
MCTIRDVTRALDEVYRVLRTGGHLDFLEHGLSPEPSVAEWQRRRTPLQRRISGGCHFDRPIDVLLSAARFEITTLRNHYSHGTEDPQLCVPRRGPEGLSPGRSERSIKSIASSRSAGACSAWIRSSQVQPPSVRALRASEPPRHQPTQMAVLEVDPGARRALLEERDVDGQVIGWPVATMCHVRSVQVSAGWDRARSHSSSGAQCHTRPGPGR